MRFFERLEPRRCLSAAWQNALNRADVDQSTLVTPIDALQIINSLNREGVRELPPTRLDSQPCLDTNGDSLLTPLDALIVINLLNRYSSDLFLLANLNSASDPNANGVVTSDTVTIDGITLPGVQLSVIELGESQSSGPGSAGFESLSDGTFHVNVPVSAGRNLIKFRATDPLGRDESYTLTVTKGDIVHDWNATILNVVREWTGTSDDPYPGRIVPSEPPRVARNMAMIHTAMFDAANAIEDRFDAYLATSFDVPETISIEAAIAAAAHGVASHLYPEADAMAYWNATLQESLARESDGSAKENGMQLGAEVAAAMLASRVGDGADSASNYEPGELAGDWNRTLPGFLPPLLPHWRYLDPFVVNSVDEYRPQAPPLLTSSAYAEAVDMVLRIGGYNGSERTEDQTEIAVFWADGAGTFTPPGHWNQIAADTSAPQNLETLDNARLFALLNLALADAGIAAWDAKYEFDFWRPIDAIRRADSDGNPATVQDSTWLPLLPTPPFPTYTSGHSTFSGAAAAVLTEVLGDNLSFVSQIDAQNAPGQRPLDASLIVTRTFDSFADAAEESGISRIYGGIHFDFDNTAGLESGHAIGSFVASSSLQPKQA